MKNALLSKPIYWCCFCILLITSNVKVSAQRIDDFGKAKPLTITGGISTNQVAYFASGISGRREPYNFFISGNLNLDIYGWSVPLGFTYSNQSKGAFQQPFNQYGLTPTYKWVTGHVGYSSMSFSGSVT